MNKSSLALILGLLLAGCTRGTPIDLYYGDQVTVVHSFFGTYCCTVTDKWDEREYQIYCPSGPEKFDKFWRNGVDVVITKGCK